MDSEEKECYVTMPNGEKVRGWARPVVKHMDAYPVRFHSEDVPDHTDGSSKSFTNIMCQCDLVEFVDGAETWKREAGIFYLDPEFVKQLRYLYDETDE